MKTNVNIIIIILTITVCTSSFSQQANKSRILNLLNEEFHSQNLYFQSFDSIQAAFANNIVLRDNKIDLYSGNEEKFRFSNNRKTFEESLKIVKSDFLLFGKFSPDTIIFYFNEKKLNRCVFHFKIRDNENDLINNILDQKLEHSGYSGHINWGGPYWSDNIMRLHLVLDSTALVIDKERRKNKFRSAIYGEQEKKLLNTQGSFTLEFEMFEAKEEITIAPKTRNEVLESPIKVDKKGTGNSTFSLSLLKMEKTIKTPTTNKMIENQLGRWTSYGAENHLSFEWDDKTKKHSIPLFRVQYSSHQNSTFYIIKTEVSQKVTNRIKYLEIITILNGIQLAEFKKSLSINGYLINEQLTDIFKKQTWQNRSKNTTVTIKENANGTYSIGIR